MNQQAIDELRAQRDELAEDLTSTIRVLDEIAKQRDEYQVEADALAAENKVLRESLERLACLGNGDRHGNSIGNEIAIAALTKEATNG
jgi:regulator of replication initiation timing